MIGDGGIIGGLSNWIMKLSAMMYVGQIYMRGRLTWNHHIWDTSEVRNP